MGGSSILAIDLGTTRCKAAVFDFRGRIFASVSRERDDSHGPAGIDQNVAGWKRDVLSCARAAVKASRRTLDRVVVTGQGSSAVWLDSRGELVRPVILHTDTRATKQAQLLGREIEHIGYVPLKVFPSLLWLKENEAANFRSIRHVLDIRQFIGYELTGEMRYDSKSFTRKANERFAELSGLDLRAFGEPHEYDEPIGSLTTRRAQEMGIPSGVPVYVAPMDGMCGIVGSGVDREGVMADVAGSTEVMSTPVPRGSPLGVLPLLDTGRMLTYQSPPFGLAYKWFLENFYGTKTSAHRRLALDVSRSAADPARPFYFPGMKSSGFQTSLSGGFFRLALSHTRKDLARAVLEGIALELARVVDSLEKGGLSIEEIRVSGGGAYQEVWNQIRADATGKEVVLPRVLETTSLGAAIVAASSKSGPYRGIEEGMQHMVKMGRRYRPRSAASKAYRERLASHRGYAELMESSV